MKETQEEEGKKKRVAYQWSRYGRQLFDALMQWKKRENDENSAQQKSFFLFFILAAPTISLR